MSRVFDALQEAARLRGPNGAPGEAVWTELGVNQAAAPRVEKETAPLTLVPDAPAAVEIHQVIDPPVAIAEPPTATQVAPLPGISGKIVLDKAARAIPHSTDPVVVERYRMLRTKLLQERDKKFFRSLIVTSASPQEGKTVTTLNLALSFAALPSFRVLVVDGDMRRGTLGEWLGIDRDCPGLSNLIQGNATLNQVVLKSEELSISVLSRGNAAVNDLESAQFSTHFRHLTEQFDLVLVDTPPVNLVTDVQVMAASCDAVLVVARAFSTTGKGLEEAIEKLQSFRIVGTVLNAGSPRRSRKYHGYY